MSVCFKTQHGPRMGPGQCTQASGDPGNTPVGYPSTMAHCMGRMPLAISASPHRHRAACSTHSSFLLQGWSALLSETLCCCKSHLPSWRPSPSRPTLPRHCSALRRLHIYPFCENNKKPQKEAMKKAFSVAARRPLREQTHQACKQQVVHPVFVFHLQQGERA